MPRLLRPHIPIETRCRVILKQLGEMWPDGVIDAIREHPENRGTGGLGALLARKLVEYAATQGCEAADLHLDHDPPLGAREKVFSRGEHIGYKPHANDPEHLFYREKRSHHIKTNVRGEHGQHPDRVLIKKNRKLEQERAREKRFLRSRPGAQAAHRNKRFKSSGVPKKAQWLARPLKSAKRWPPKGSRKLTWRR